MQTRIAVLVACALITYWNALSTPFILDDDTAIVSNASIQQLTFPGPLLTPSDTPVARRPLVNLSFAINYAVGGLDPRGYHVGNLLVHVLAALAFMGVVRRTLLLPPLQPTFARAAAPLAWMCALVWLTHPLNSEVIGYVTQRSTGMLGVFYLSTLYCAIRAATSRVGRRWEAAALACCAAGMLSKESMVTAPLVVLTYDRALLFDCWGTLLARRRFLYAGLATTWVLLAVTIASSDRTSAGFGAYAAGLGTTVSPWDYLLNQARMIPHYLLLSVWPRALVVDYGLTTPVAWESVASRGGALVLAVLAVGYGLWRRWPAALPAAWFFITLAPTSSFIPIATEVGAERRMYLPLAGLIVLVATTLFVVAKRIGVRGMQVAVPCAALIAVLALGTMRRNRDYQDPVRLAETVVERWPSGRAYASLGLQYDERGDQARAVAEFRNAAAAYPMGHYLLGVALMEQQQTDEALMHLREFIRTAPTHEAVIGARDAIGRVLIDRGDLAGASREFELLLAGNPADARAAALLGEVRLRQQRIAEAVTLFARAYQLNRRIAADPVTMSRFGTALALSHEFAAAERVFAEAALANPNDPGLQKLWGRSLAAVARFSDAADHFRRASELAPDDLESRQLVASIERRLGSAGRP